MGIEYKIIDQSELAQLDDNLEIALNKLGSDRWELIEINYNCAPYYKYIFKRNKLDYDGGQ